MSGMRNAPRLSKGAAPMAFSRTPTHVITAHVSRNLCWFRVSTDGLVPESSSDAPQGCVLQAGIPLAVDGTTLWMGDHRLLDGQGQRLWTLEPGEAMSFRVSAHGSVPTRLAYVALLPVPQTQPVLMTLGDASSESDWVVAMAINDGIDFRVGGSAPIPVRVGTGVSFTWMVDAENQQTTVMRSAP
jgi:hypothetical protein